MQVAMSVNGIRIPAIYEEAMAQPGASYQILVSQNGPDEAGEDICIESCPTALKEVLNSAT